MSLKKLGLIPDNKMFNESKQLKHFQVSRVRCFTKIRCFFPRHDDSVKHHQATGPQEAGWAVPPRTTRGHQVHLLSNSCHPFGSMSVSARGHPSDMDCFQVTGGGNGHFIIFNSCL